MQETVTCVCSLKLKSCSPNVIFILTDDNALKMSIPMKQLDTRDPNSDDVWMTGLLGKYKARLHTVDFEKMYMTDFASNYSCLWQTKDVKKCHITSEQHGIYSEEGKK